MKSHPRIRKAIKWGGAAVTVLLVVVWIGSAWCCAQARHILVALRAAGSSERYELDRSEF